MPLGISSYGGREGWSVGNFWKFRRIGRKDNMVEVWCIGVGLTNIIFYFHNLVFVRPDWFTPLINYNWV